MESPVLMKQERPRKMRICPKNLLDDAILISLLF